MSKTSPAPAQTAWTLRQVYYSHIQFLVNFSKICRKFIVRVFSLIHFAGVFMVYVLFRSNNL